MIWLGLWLMGATMCGAVWVALWPRCWPKRDRPWPGPDRATLMGGIVLGGIGLATMAPALLLFAPIGAALVGIDARRGVLPDGPVLICAGAGGSACVVGILPHGPMAALAGAALGAGLFWALAVVFRRVRGRTGLGDGDIRLMGALGLWVGVAAVPLVVTLAASAALVVAGLRRQGRLAFGPFLVLAATAVLAWDFLEIAPLLR